MEEFEYGYIDNNGYLRSRFFAPISEMVKNEDGTASMVEVSVEEQLARLSGTWKPVDHLDEARMESEDPDFVIVLVPYDAGDHIAYNYLSKFDRKGVMKRIQVLKDKLSSTDYKIMKCYEATMLKEALPYDVSELHIQRQAWRDDINELEGKLAAHNDL